jgi:hypothetical protein
MEQDWGTDEYYNPSIPIYGEDYAVPADENDELREEVPRVEEDGWAAGSEEGQVFTQKEVLPGERCRYEDVQKSSPSIQKLVASGKVPEGLVGVGGMMKGLYGVQNNRSKGQSRQSEKRVYNQTDRRRRKRPRRGRHDGDDSEEEAEQLEASMYGLSQATQQERRRNSHRSRGSFWFLLFRWFEEAVMLLDYLLRLLCCPKNLPLCLSASLPLFLEKKQSLYSIYSMYSTHSICSIDIIPISNHINSNPPSSLHYTQKTGPSSWRETRR